MRVVRSKLLPTTIVLWLCVWVAWHRWHQALRQRFLRTHQAIGSLLANDILVVYVYSEGSQNGHGKGMHPENLKFFLDHALHPYADFVFVLNGNSSIALPELPNVQVLRMENECFDFGRWGQVVLKEEIMSKYRRFILMNASVRGPFMPTWSEDCWTDVFADRVNEKVKLVGTTMNCIEIAPHVQSMLLATDRQGLEALRPSLQCFTNYEDAVNKGEVAATRHIRSAGYSVESLMIEAHSKGDDVMRLLDHCNWTNPNDIHRGTSVHPFDVIFAKASADVDQKQLKRYTSWVNGRGYRSDAVCGRSRGFS